jgi:proline iminopeptidase
MTRDMREERPYALYPSVAPYDHGYLDVGDGHRLYWEACGDPRGRPAVFLHGGPGGGCSADHRRLFDPNRYNVILFDQRGCGRSRPHAAVFSNTTQHLIADLEKLRAFRGIERWLLVGGSWGSTLALAYAQRYPQRVSAMVLRGVFTARARELRWLYEDGASNLFPEDWDAFIGFLPPEARSAPIEGYHALLAGPNARTRIEAARAWCAWETAAMTLTPRPKRTVEAGENESLFALARIETHYFVHQAFLDEGEILHNASRLAAIPGVIVQGRYDCVTPPATAWELHKAWQGSVLDVAPEAGHASSEPGVARRLLEALDHFARR